MSHRRYPLSDADQAKMLRKLLLYWDWEWFLNAVDTYGLEEAIALNARVRASFARFEMRVTLKAVGKRHADDLPDAMRLIETYAKTFMGSALRAEFTKADEVRAKVKVHRCAAFEGAKRANLTRVDQACVACEGLWNAWLEALLPDSQVEVQYPARLGKGDPHCSFVVQVEGP
jgi:predicted hydrocarbon binding protein